MIHPSFYRDFQGSRVSSLGLGTYLGDASQATNDGYTEAVRTAAREGINFFDTSLNYRNQHSERALGRAFQSLPRDSFFVSTKAGYLVPGAVPQVDAAGIFGNMHCMTPAFLDDQLARSAVNLNVEQLDIFYLHNPETQLQFRSEASFYTAVRDAFTACEEFAASGRLRYYGVATWNAFLKAQISLERLWEIATAVAGQHHRFRAIQLPVNLGMPEGIPTVIKADALGISVFGSAAILQGRLADGLSDPLRQSLPHLSTDAQRAIQFSRSVPGMTVSLVGMSQPRHVLENISVASTPPLTVAEFETLFKR